MRTVASLAAELSRDMGLGLSNAEFEALCEIVRPDPERELARLWKMRPDAVRAEVRRRLRRSSGWPKP